MSPPESELRGFKVVLVTVGLVYALMASSALMRGVGMLRDFAVPEAMVASPVLGDFFSFVYENMAFVGLLMVLFGLVTRGRRAQRLVAGVFCASSLLFAARDLSTSDSRFGNHLYRGEATLVFVGIGLCLALAFGALLVSGRSR